MKNKQIISSGLLETYVLGICSAEEAAEVAKAKLVDDAVAHEIDSIEKSFETYAIHHAVAPSPSQKESIFKTIHFSQSIALPKDLQAAPVVSMWKRIAVAACFLLIGSAIANVIFYNKYSEENTKFQGLSSTYQTQQEALASSAAKVETMDNEMAIVQNKYSVPVALNGLQAAPNAAAKVFWIKNTGEVYVAPGNLPKAPAGKQYQLWGIVDGKPVDGGMISTGNVTAHFQKMKSFGKAQAFAITLEDTGGSETPKGEMYVMGTL